MHATHSEFGLADPAASHSARSVVLPNPAGAETIINVEAAPRSRRSVNRGRGTRPRRDLGTKNFVWSKGAGTSISCPTLSRKSGATPVSELDGCLSGC